MHKVELAKKKLEMKTMDHSIAQFEFRIFESECEIERIREQIAICAKRKETLETEIMEEEV